MNLFEKVFEASLSMKWKKTLRMGAKIWQGCVVYSARQGRPDEGMQFSTPLSIVRRGRWGKVPLEEYDDVNSVIFQRKKKTSFLLVYATTYQGVTRCIIKLFIYNRALIAYIALDGFCAAVEAFISKSK